MSKKAIGFLGRMIYSSKIKSYENKYIEIQKEDWSSEPWQEYAKDCFKLETQTKEYIHNSSGSQRMEYVCGLQALYNIREKELNYIEETIQKMPISELTHFFESEYNSILNNIKETDFKSAMDLYSEFVTIINSKDIQKNYKWKYVSACLLIFAVEEVFGNELNNFKRNIRSL